jgi:hypothetical protein
MYVQVATVCTPGAEKPDSLLHEQLDMVPSTVGTSAGQGGAVSRESSCTAAAGGKERAKERVKKVLLLLLYRQVQGFRVSTQLMVAGG